MLVAIDPGKAGAIAWRTNGGVIDVRPMPETDGDVIMTLGVLNTQAQELKEEVSVIIEAQVGAGMSFAKKEDGEEVRVGTNSMFKFGKGYGFILGAVAMAGWRTELVIPRKWIGGLSLGTRGSRSKVEWKNHLKQAAQRLHPGRHITLKTCDALLILEYAVRNAGLFGIVNKPF